MVTVSEMQFSFMSERETIDVFILKRMQEEFHAKVEKFYMWCVDLEKAFVRVPRKVWKWAMGKKGIPEVLVRSVMNQYEGAKTRVRVNSDLSEECEVKVGIHQGSVLSHFLFAFVVDVVTRLARDGVLSCCMLMTVLMNKTIEGLSNTFLKWKFGY